MRGPAGVSFLLLMAVHMLPGQCVPNVSLTGYIGEQQCPAGSPDYYIDATQYLGLYPDGYSATLTGSGPLSCSTGGQCPGPNNPTNVVCQPTTSSSSGSGYFSVTTTSYTATA